MHGILEFNGASTSNLRILLVFWCAVNQGGLEWFIKG